MACKNCGANLDNVSYHECGPVQPNIVPTSLRDWFAGMAMQTMSVCINCVSLKERESVARRCYEIADAMMKRRGE